jgi:hypothetical protein
VLAANQFPEVNYFPVISEGLDSSMAAAIANGLHIHISTYIRQALSGDVRKKTSFAPLTQAIDFTRKYCDGVGI